MSFARLPSALRAVTVTPSHLTIQQQRQASTSVLFALSSLSNSRETQHFNKLSQLNRIEHSPTLKLIKTSEVDPFPLPAPPPKPAVPLVRLVGGSRSTSPAWDEKALKVGRVVLSDHARHTSRLQKALQRAKRREARQEAVMKKDRMAWQQEARKLRNEMRVAGVWILLSIGTATALATWRFWPQQGVADSGEMGRKIAERARRSMPLPAATSRESVLGASAAAEPEVQKAVAASAAVEPALASPVVPAPVSMQPQPTGSWWKSLFWKQ